MAMMGISEMFIVVAMLFGGGAGIPLSLPPAEPDALLDKLSPKEAVFYSNWSGVGKIDPNSQNATEALFGEPEIQQFVQKAEALARMALAKAGERDESARMASQIVPPLVRAALTRPAMMYVRELEIGPEGPQFKAGVVMNLGPSFNEVTRLLKLIPEGQAEPVEILGTQFQRFKAPAPGAPSITVGTRGPYVIIGIGDGEAEAILARANQAAPAWIAQLRSRFKVDRVATITRFDVASVIEKAAPLGGPQVTQVLQMTGLDAVKDYVGVTGLDAKGFVQFAALDIEGEPRGLFALTPESPLTSADLAPIPLGSLVGTAFKTDLSKILEGALEMVGQMDPNAIEQFNGGIQQVEQVLGMRVREDVLASLGDVWTLHTHEEDGGLLSGWTATVSLKNASKITQLSQRVMQLATQAARGQRDPKIEWSQYDQHNLFTFSVPDAEMPFAPCWCVTKDRLVVGLFPQAVKSYLIRQKRSDKSLAEEPQVAAMLKTSASSIAAVDNKRFAELLYPMAQIGLRMAVAQAQREEIPIDYTMLPSLTSIARHLGTGVTVSRRTATGFEVEQHQALPSGNVGATAPIAIALILPAVQSARGAARRMSSSNNLKQIGIAVHNFHDTFKSFPPRYSTDKDGKPLLSWRVYILPFIEQQALYEQFHLDEPWDSEHNKKLIPMMPQVYVNPTLPLPAGKTTYLSLAAKDAIFQGPREGENGKKFPRTTGFRDVTDGTSNTVMVVEANLGSAVTWTKPDDYEYGDADPARGLRGVYPNVIQVGMADGSVRALSAALDPKTLKALFTRNGGEPIDYQQLNR